MLLCLDCRVLGIVLGSEMTILRHTRKRAGSVFGSYNKKKKGAWKHNFFCLAYVGQARIPTSESEKDDLFDAGLGEKDVEFEQLDISPDEFKEVIFSVFPKLRAAGGFQLCKCVPNSRKLEPLSSRVLLSPLLLKQRIVIYCSPSKRFRFDPSRGQRTLCKYIHNFSCVIRA